MKKLLLGLALLASLAIGVAVAQVPGLFITSPTGAEQINVTGTGPQIETIYLKQARDAVGYQISAVTSGTVTFGAATSQLVLTAGSTISTLTVALTQAPVDGQRNCWFNQSAITTLTMSAASGQTIGNPITSTSATTRYCWVYQLSSTTWNRLQ